MSRPLRTAAGDVPAAPLVLVDVQTNEGIVGRSYAFAYTPLMLRTLVQFLRDVAPELVGETVSPRERMRQLEGLPKQVTTPPDFPVIVPSNTTMSRRGTRRRPALPR